jgi:hypothetical protein
MNIYHDQEQFSQLKEVAQEVDDNIVKIMKEAASG